MIAHLLFVTWLSGVEPLPALQELTPQETRQLAEALFPEGRRLPAVAIEPFDSPLAPGFHFYDVWWSDGVGGDKGGHVGSIAVDPRTGDVWKAVVCERIDNKELRRLQQRMRGAHGISTQVYRRLRRPGPMCCPEKPHCRAAQQRNAADEAGAGGGASPLISVLDRR